MEVSCHHLSLLGDPASCIFDVGLRAPRAASKKVTKMLLDMLEVPEATDVAVPLHARFSPYGLCKRGDVVLLKDSGVNTYKAAKLLMLAEVEGVSMILVEEWTLKSIDSSNGFSKWSPKNASNKLALLEDILGTVSHTAINGDKVVTVMHSPVCR